MYNDNYFRFSKTGWWYKFKIKIIGYSRELIVKVKQIIYIFKDLTDKQFIFSILNGIEIELNDE